MAQRLTKKRSPTPRTGAQYLLHGDHRLTPADLKHLHKKHIYMDWSPHTSRTVDRTSGRRKARPPELIDRVATQSCCILLAHLLRWAWPGIVLKHTDSYSCFTSYKSTKEPKFHKVQLARAPWPVSWGNPVQVSRFAGTFRFLGLGFRA